MLYVVEYLMPGKPARCWMCCNTPENKEMLDVLECAGKAELTTRGKKILRNVGSVNKY